MKQPIKRKQKSTKQQSQPIDSTNNLNIYLTRDLEPSMQLQGLYNGPTNYGEQYGETPQIDQSLPVDHPKNIRAAIAQKQGWVEVPIKYIDIDVNKRWENKIRQTAAKYGPDAKYIVNPKTREIIPESTFKQMQTDLAFQNTSGQIQDQNTQFEIQQAQNHRNLQRRDPQGLAYITLAAGALTNPLTATALGYLGQADYLYNGYKRAYDLYNSGQTDKALAEAFGTTVIGGIPYGKYAAMLKYAPKVGIPLLAAATAADAYAQDTPKNFQPSLTPEEQNMVMDDSTDWEAISMNNEQRDAWIDKIKKELERAEFSFDLDRDEYLQKAMFISGNKDVQPAPERKKFVDYYDKDYLTEMGVRYGVPLGGWAIYEGAKRFIPKFQALPPAKKLFYGYYGLNLMYDVLGRPAWAYYKDQQTQEQAPDGYDEVMANYYRKLLNVYTKLNGSKMNTYVKGSTFGPMQTYPKVHNFDSETKQKFSAPDTNARVIIQGRVADTTSTNQETSSDSLTNLISNTKVP